MIAKFISPMLSAAVEGYAMLDRASDRQRLLANAQALVDAEAHSTQPRTLVVVRSPHEARRLLPMVRTGTAVVFLDCVLERCGTEEDLLNIWTDARRATGDDRHLFVLTLQTWATARLLLDPRIRWVILQTSPKGPLLYRAMGRRSTLLADVRQERVPS